jgi:hypothetical protein
LPRRRGGFEAAHAALVEVDLGRERLDTQRQALHLDGDARRFGDDFLEHLILQCVPFGLTPIGGGFALDDLAIDRVLRLEGAQDGGEDGRERREQALEERRCDIRVLDLERGRWRRDRKVGRRRAAPELLEQGRLDGPRIQDGLEPACRQLVDLLIGQVEPRALGDP